MTRATTQRRDGKGSRQRAPSTRRTSKEATEAPIAENPSRTPAVTKLYPTKNDLPEATRTEVITLLNQRLADGIDLQTQCKQAHWNVKRSEEHTSELQSLPTSSYAVFCLKKKK